jgi:peptidoglycan hydrolase-like protein with peptidoglycan-binding domain
METENELRLIATIADGALTICREDGQAISVMTHEEIGSPVEVCRIGSTGHAVKAMQALLNCHGQHLDEDGIMGNLTQTALIIFQDACNLPATGECDLLTWQALIGE